MPFGCRNLTTSTSARVTSHSRNSVTRGDCRAIRLYTRINLGKASQIHANSKIERAVSAIDGTFVVLPLCFVRICFFLAALPRKDEGTGVTSLFSQSASMCSSSQRQDDLWRGFH